MSLPPSFSSSPSQDPHKYFKNLIISFKEEVNGAADIDELEQKMQILINASKEMKSNDKHQKDVFHKTEADKGLTKLFKEFDRYIMELKNTPSKANRQDLLNAISIVENLIKENDIF
jgi:hypothetical protein